MIRYYKLFDMLNRRGMKKTDLLEIISSKTIAKLSKGDNLNTDIIDKICLYLHCQPSDIMEVVENEEIHKDYIAYGKEYVKDTDVLGDGVDEREYDITDKVAIFRDRETQKINDIDVIEENKIY